MKTYLVRYKCRLCTVEFTSSEHRDLKALRDSVWRGLRGESAILLLVTHPCAPDTLGVADLLGVIPEEK